MIRLDSICKSFGSRALLDDVHWLLPVNRTVGLVGPNGAGKTTLLSIIAGQHPPDSGQVIVPKGVRVGYLSQEFPAHLGGSLMDVVLRGRQDLLDMEERLAQMERELETESGQHSESLQRAYGDLQEQFRRRDGYSFRSRAREIASGIGFRPEQFTQSILDFSGGWQMRALLAQLLVAQPEILLLDEPTNHLDMESLEWLEGFLGSYQGTVVIVSHDRYFLNRLVQEVAELAHSRITVYPGNYDRYLIQRAEIRERLLAQAEQQQKEIDRIEKFVDRFRAKATKATQVQSRVKQLDRIDRIEVPDDATASIRFRFPQPPRTGKTVLRLTEAAKAYGEKLVYEGVNFELNRGDKIALVGPNGAGKTTLLKMLAGVLDADRGQLEVGHLVTRAYFAQHSLDALDPKRTVLQEMEAHATMEATPRVRSILGALLFRDDDVHKPISVLSGGEKNRLALSKMLLEPAGCLLLDEPTNHLDIASRQMLESALQQYEGAFCVISHDRYFLNEVATCVVHIENGRLEVYPGNYDYYRWKRDQELAALQATRSTEDRAGQGDGSRQPVSKKDIRRAAAEIRKRRDAETRTLRQDLEKTEGRIHDLESRRDKLEQQLAHPETYEKGEDVARLNQQYQTLGIELEAMMGQWEEQGARLEAIDQRYAQEEARMRTEEAE